MKKSLLLPALILHPPPPPPPPASAETGSASGQMLTPGSVIFLFYATKTF